MFTGIIEEVGEVVRVRGGELRVRAEKVLRQTKPGDSIAVDGVDLTVTAIVKRTVRFGVIQEDDPRPPAGGPTGQPRARGPSG